MNHRKSVFIWLTCLLLCIAFQQSACGNSPEDGPSAQSNSLRCLLLGGYAALGQPSARLAEDYGTFGEIGGSILYLTRSRLLFGLEGGFLFGENVLKDPVPNLRNPDGTVNGTDGRDAVFKVFQRGTSVPALRIGYMFPYNWPLKNRNKYGGYTVSTSCMWFRNYTYIQDLSKATPQFSDQYRIGYDRLVTGPAIGLWLGYLFLSENNRINLMLEAGYLAGFTKTARYSFVSGEPAGINRRDDQIQLRLKLYFSIRSRDENTIYYY